jgi:hypothetical protein
MAKITYLFLPAIEPRYCHQVSELIDLLVSDHRSPEIFIHVLYNDAASTTENTASNGGMSSE